MYRPSPPGPFDGLSGADLLLALVLLMLVLMRGVVATDRERFCATHRDFCVEQDEGLRDETGRWVMEQQD